MRTTGPAQPAELLLDVFDVLAPLQIPSAVIGALAVSFYGIPRASTDVDAFMWLGAQKSTQDVKDTLVAAGYQALLRKGGIDDPIIASIRIDDSHGNRMDLLFGIRGMDPKASERCVETSLLGAKIRVVAPEDLVAMKLFAGGPKDLEDIRGILQVSGAKLDSSLLRQTAARFGSEASRTLERLLGEAAAQGSV